MKLFQLFEADEPSDKDLHMNRFRSLAYHSEKAEKKLARMFGENIFKKIARFPGHEPDWHENHRMGVGIPDTPENQKHIANAKRYEEKVHGHVRFAVDNPLPDDLSYDELNELQDKLTDAEYELDQNAVSLWRRNFTDTRGCPLFVMKQDLEDSEFTALSDEDRGDFVLVFGSVDNKIFAKNIYIGSKTRLPAHKQAMVDYMVELGKQCKKVSTLNSTIAAKMEWIEKGERKDETE